MAIQTSVNSGATPATPMTVSDTTPDPSANPQDPDGSITATTQKPGTSTVQQSNGSGLDADTLNHLSGVAASVAGPNVYVATDASGKLPLSIIPSNPSAYTGPTTQEILTLVSGTTYSNGHSTPEWITAYADSGSNGNILCTIAALVGTSGSPGTPSVPAGLDGGNSAGGGPVVGSITFVVLPGFSYKVTVSNMTLEPAVGWY